MDSRFQNNFFAKDQIVYHIGVQDSIVKLYEQAIQVAMEEKAACQQYLAGIANLILGMTMYYSQNYEFDNKATEQISKAKVFIRENLLKRYRPGRSSRLPAHELFLVPETIQKSIPAFLRHTTFRN